MPEEPNIMKKGYRPPFLIRVFLDFLIEPVKKGWKITVVVENFRFLFHLGFLGTIIVGFVLTTMFVDFDHSKVVMDIFGAPNVCTYFDFPPATYVAPLAYSFAVLAGIMYGIFSITRLSIAYKEKKISCRVKTLMIAIYTYFIVSVIWFGTIYAVQPNRADPVTMRIHTVPYINFKIAVISMQYCVVWFGTRVAWNNIGFSSNGKILFFSLSWLHVYLNFVECGFSCFVILNGIGDMGPSGLVGKGLWFNVHDKPQFVRMVGTFIGNKSPLGDLVLSQLIPLIQSLFIKSKSFNRISNTHTVTFNVYDNISA